MVKKTKDKKQRLIEILIILVIGLIILMVALFFEVIKLQNQAHDWCEVVNLGADGLNMLSGYLIEYDIKWEALPEVTKVNCPLEVTGFKWVGR